MKKYTLFLILLICAKFYAQENKIFISKEKFQNTIVENVKTQKRKMIYDKIIKWITLNYKDPSKVISAKIENELIRFEGIDNLYWVQYDEPRTDYYQYPVKYTIEINIKDYKYQFKITDLQTRMSGSFEKFNILNNPEYYYDKTGHFYKSQSPTEYELPKYFNNLNKSIYNFVLGVEQNKSND